MRDGVEEGWPSRSLGEICDFHGGTQPPKSKFIDKPKKGYVRLLQIRDFKSDDKAVYVPDDGKLKKCEADDIMIGRYGASVGQIHRGKSGAHNVALIRTSPDLTLLDRDFFYYYLTSELFQRPLIEKSARGAQNGFNRADIASFEVPLPPLEEQKWIVAKLDQAFTALDRARAHAEANLADAGELYQQASNEIIFGNSQDLPDHQDLRNIERLSSEQKKRSADKKFRKPVLKSAEEWPRIPDGWLWASPEQLSTHIVDCLHTTPKWTDNGELCLRTTNFRPGDLDLSVKRFVSKETYLNRVARLEPLPGDVLYSREGGILGIACILPSGVKACLGQRMMQFRVRADIILPDFLCAVLNSGIILKEVKHNTAGAAAPHLNIGVIRQFPIPVPPLCLQRVLVEKLADLTSMREHLISEYRTKLTDLADLRQSLLQKAFSGQL